MIIKCIHTKPVWTADPERTWNTDDQMEVDDSIAANLMATKKFVAVKNEKSELKQEQKNYYTNKNNKK